MFSPNTISITIARRPRQHFFTKRNTQFITQKEQQINGDFTDNINKSGAGEETTTFGGGNNNNNSRDDFNILRNNEEFLLAVTTKGFGKRSSAYEYRISNRGGKGITGILTTAKNGNVIDSFVIKQNDQIIIVSDKGQIIRINVNQIRIAGRSTQGVSIFKIPDGDKIVYVSRVEEIES